MKARDIMTRRVATATPDTSLVEIARLLVENDCGAIPILDDETSRRPVGMITDRDIVCRVVAASENPGERAASDCMSTPCVTVGEDTSFDACCASMETARVRRLVVVDEEGRCCGIVSQADVARRVPDKAGEVVREVSQPGGSPTALTAGGNRPESRGAGTLRSVS
jgi:CBS domain-containing protein